MSRAASKVTTRSTASEDDGTSAEDTSARMLVSKADQIKASKMDLVRWERDLKKCRIEFERKSKAPLMKSSADYFIKLHDRVQTTKAKYTLHLGYMEEELQGDDTAKDYLDKCQETDFVHCDLVEEVESRVREQRTYQTLLSLREDIQTIGRCRDLTSERALDKLEAVSKTISDTVGEVNALANHELTDLREETLAMMTAQFERSEDQLRNKDKDAPVLIKDVPDTKPTVHSRLFKQADLPKFHGDVLQWKEFWSLFSSIVDKDDGLGPPEKLTLLRGSMATPALQARVDGLDARRRDYDDVVRQMRDIYDRDQAYSRHLMKEEIVKQERLGDSKDDWLDMGIRVANIEKKMDDCGLTTRSQIVAYFYEQKLSPNGLEDWLKFTAKEPIYPNLDSMKKFVEEEVLTTPDHKRSTVESIKREKSYQPRQRQVDASSHSLVATGKNKCSLCNGNHWLGKCNKFLAMNQQERHEHVSRVRGCFNCLNAGHRSQDCKNERRCGTCQKRHHTTLHRDRSDDRRPNTGQSHNPSDYAPMGSIPQVTTVDGISCFGRRSAEKMTVVNVRRTALGTIASASVRQLIRIFFDTGSDFSIISARLAAKLRVRRVSQIKKYIVGISGEICMSDYQAEVVLLSHYGPQKTIRIIVEVMETIPAIPGSVPTADFLKLPFLLGRPLADLEYGPGKKVDMILGNPDVVACLTARVAVSKDGKLRAEESIFGWTLGGSALLPIPDRPEAPVCMNAVKKMEESRADKIMEALWEQEKMPGDETPASADDERALAEFAATHTRDPDGRYRVKLTRKLPTPALGRSREAARRRLLQARHKLTQESKWTEYYEALANYHRMGHSEMVPVEDLKKSWEKAAYLPTLAVYKASSTTTKLRLVFDASAKTSNKVSLNDTLIPGPNLNPLLTTAITRFRKFVIAISADIGKMYREVGLNKSDQDFHRYFLPDEDGSLREFRMTRLTFGVTCSAFLAIRVLRQLAADYSNEFPRAAVAIQENFYVDDCLTGADTVEEAISLRVELYELLGKANMLLRKWRASSQEVLDTIPADLLDVRGELQLSSPKDQPKALGIHWDSKEDTFHIATPSLDTVGIPTKRLLASAAAKVFDVLGWFSPATIPARVMLQELWQWKKIGWDDKIPEVMHARWYAWVRSINCLTNVCIPRCISSANEVLGRQLHGFGDASQTAFGGVVYLRTIYAGARIETHLIMAKAKVAPIKRPTIHRLELQGAVVTAKLLKMAAADLQVPDEYLYGWSDSSTTLAWLKTSKRLTVFVKNRVNIITDLVPAVRWRYVATEQNPADYLSRGVAPEKMKDLQMWWQGPPWLHQEPAKWPKRLDIDGEKRLPGFVLLTTTPRQEIGSRVSSLWKMLKVFGYLLRFVDRFIQRRRGKLLEVQPRTLSQQEIERARNEMYRYHQKTYFSDIVNELETKGRVGMRQQFANLTPTLDKGVVRVGGRLCNAGLGYSQSHPIILHPKSHLVLLIIRQVHIISNHSGIGTMQTLLAGHFHIPRLRQKLKGYSRNCVTCKKDRARTIQPPMGQLPANRVTIGATFEQTGVDYAGPFLFKQGPERRPQRLKCYIALFICMCTKAVHLELVQSQSAPDFLAALQRFVGRRGLPKDIFSDNGSNFHSVKEGLKEDLQFMTETSSKEYVKDWAAQRNIKWHFSPARSPHFGGLWEANIKSMKEILRKTVGQHLLTYSEFENVLIETEATLNSRPLLPPDSLDAGEMPLSTGHFTAGRPLKALPMGPPSNHAMHLAKRWNVVQQINRDVWDQWQTTYLQFLQKVNKWKSPSRVLKVDDIVLLKDNEQFQRYWPMGRVTKICPGKDGLVRAAEVLCNGRTFNHATNKLVHLLDHTELQATPLEGEYV